MTMTTTMTAREQQMTAQRDSMTTTMATGDDDNDIDGNGATGNKGDNDGDDDGDGATGNKVDDDGDGATGDDNDDECDYDVLYSKFVLLTWKGGWRPVDHKHKWSGE
jgi:hypothetical protein